MILYGQIPKVVVSSFWDEFLAGPFFTLFHVVPFYRGYVFPGLFLREHFFPALFFFLHSYCPCLSHRFYSPGRIPIDVFNIWGTEGTSRMVLVWFIGSLYIFLNRGVYVYGRFGVRTIRFIVFISFFLIVIRDLHQVFLTIHLKCILFLCSCLPICVCRANTCPHYLVSQLKFIYRDPHYFWMGEKQMERSYPLVDERDNCLKCLRDVVNHIYFLLNLLRKN